MTFQMRREGREEVGRRAWLDIGADGLLFNCTLLDLSESGAKLAIDANDQIPAKFDLLLTRHGKPRYSCQVVWRNSEAIGVKFASR